MDAVFNGLNDRQREAVTATEGYVRVIAGAGSGKTKLLVSRYAYLVLALGIDPANILCVTFTNKAAGEMKARIRAAIGEGYDTGLTCTYHGFCARLLREDGGRLFLDRGFRILDTGRMKGMLEEIYRKRELRLDHASFEDILRKLGRIKADTAYVPAMTDPTPRRILADVAVAGVSEADLSILEELLQRQKAVIGLDFHDLINYALYLLETNAEVRSKWQERLNYIQVDEFQDSSRRELHLVELLSGGYGNLMIVGDPDQNIYEWRGSDVRLLVDFDKAHTPCRTVFLDRNYRSTPQILTCANTLIDCNKVRLKKDLYTCAPPGEPVMHYHEKSDGDEAARVLALVRELHAGGCAYADMAVLYRSGFLSRTVEKKLTEGHIPYEIVGGVRFFRRMEVLDMMAYLRLIATGDDDAFRRIVNVPRRKLGRGRLELLERLAAEGSRNRTIDAADSADDDRPGGLLGALYAGLADPDVGDALRGTGAAEFASVIRALRHDAPSLRVSDIVRRVCAETGYEAYIRSLGDEERLENLAEFQRMAEEFEKGFGEDLSLPAFLTQLDLQAAEGESATRDAVRLMTIHASKGLEFPVVFLLGLTEGIFPSGKTLEERKQAGLEEERRLCYVALTRARQRLFLLDSEGFSENGGRKLPSRFLREIGTDNYNRIGAVPEELERASLAAARQGQNAPRKEERATGEAVEHPVFGRGIIIGRDEARGSYIVRFDKLDKPRHISRSFFEGPPRMPVLPAAPETAPERLPAPAEDADTAPPAPQPPEPVPKFKPVPEAVPEQEPTHSEPDGGIEIIPLDIEPTAPEAAPEKPRVSRTAGGENLWRRDDVPHSGWSCTGVSDLGEPAAVCGMCGEQIIRYVHHMTHPAYRPLGVGCVCAGRMEGDPQAARERERTFRKRETRRRTFMNRTWRRSRDGNEYLRVRGHVLVLYRIKGSGWTFYFDGERGGGIYPDRDAALDAAFEKLDSAPPVPGNRT